MKRFTPYLIGALVGMLVLAAFTIGQVSAAPRSATGCFSDTNGHWAETFICWAAEFGIVGGFPDGTYRPENNVTRAQAAVMLKNQAEAFLSELSELEASLSELEASLSELEASLSELLEQQAEIPPTSGDIVVNVGPSTWLPNGSSTQHYVTYFTNTNRLRSLSTGTYGFNANVTVPSMIYGKATRLKSMRLCYTASESATLDSVYLRLYANSNGIGTSLAEVNDETSRTDATCRNYTILLPVSLLPGDQVSVYVTTNISNVSSFLRISSLSLIFEPTDITPSLMGPMPMRPEMPGLLEPLPGEGGADE